MMNLDIEKVEIPCQCKLGIQDKWILAKLNQTINKVRDNLDSYELGIALSEIYDFVWDIFCDWYIELSKTTLGAKGTDANLVSQNVIVYVLESILKLLHPFMPFITEEIYQSLPHFENSESIMITSYPVAKNEYNFDAELEAMERVIETIKAVRARRTEMNVPPSKRAKLFIVTRYSDSFNEGTFEFFKKLASASEVEVVSEYEGENAVQIITHAGTVYIPMAEMVDTEKEKARLNAELDKVNMEIDRLERKLSNAEFVAKAPQKVVEGERAKLEKYKSQKQGILDAIASL